MTIQTTCKTSSAKGLLRHTIQRRTKQVGEAMLVISVEEFPLRISVSKLVIKEEILLCSQFIHLHFWAVFRIHHIAFLLNYSLFFIQLISFCQRQGEFYSKTSKTHQCLKFILFWNDTLHVPDDLSVHHQQFVTVHTTTGICQTGTDTAR